MKADRIALSTSTITWRTKLGSITKL
jgi:hypothetical protein